LLEVVFFSNALIIIPSISLHLSHVFDFLMLIFFMLAMTGYGTGAFASQKPAGGQNDSIAYANQKGESVSLEK